MDPVLGEWLGLALRWAHIITGIAWIGSSFLFMWLDSHLEPPEKPKKGVEGELWMTHSGGFYVVEKMALAPDEVPRTLHWFKWEAAWTWITGFLLLMVVYYLGSASFLIDPEVADITHTQAIVISLALFVAAWAVYDGMYRSPLRHTGIWAEIIGIVLLCVVIFGLTKLFSGRGAYVHVGAMIGTIMVANVWMIIIPGQRKLVEATKAGTTLDPALAFNAKQRSIHNNYLTLPVVFIMMSSHYAGTYGHEYNWAILIGMFVVGALARHWFNLRNAGSKSIWPVLAAALGFMALAYLASPYFAAPGSASIDEDADPVTFAQAYEVIEKRCVSCHAQKPADENFDTAPKNVKFDTPAQIKAEAARIRAVAVMTKTMPLGNQTKMTQAERVLLGRWIADGAEIE